MSNPNGNTLKPLSKIESEGQEPEVVDFGDATVRAVEALEVIAGVLEAMAFKQGLMKEEDTVYRLGD